MRKQSSPHQQSSSTPDVEPRPALAPTFIKLFGNDPERGTEYIAISTITKAHVVTKPRERGEPEIELHVYTLEGAKRIVTGAEAAALITTLDQLAPASSGSIAGTGESDVTTS